VEDTSAAAQRAFQEGEELHKQGTVESLRKAIARYSEAVSLARGVGNRSMEARTLNNMGFAYTQLGEQQKALDSYNQALPMERALNDRAGEAKTLIYIGLAYTQSGERQKALDYYNQALPLVRALGDRAGEAKALNDIGLTYFQLGEQQKALDYYNQALLLERALGDKLEAGTLNNIGLAYLQLAEWQKALDYFNQALPLARALGDRAGEPTMLLNIGQAHSYLGEQQKALDYFNQALNLARARGDRSTEALALHNIATEYVQLGEPQKALDYYIQVLPLERALGNRSPEALTLNNIGLAYGKLGEPQKALDYYIQALPLERALGERSTEALTLNNIGMTYFSLGEQQKALEYYNQALSLARAVRDRTTEALALNNIAIAYFQLSEQQKALDYYIQALALERALGARTGEALTLNNIGSAYNLLGEPLKALDYYLQALALERALGDRSGEATTLVNFGFFYERLGERQKALDCYNQALAFAREIGERTTEAQSLALKARLERRAGYVAAARADNQAALNIVETLRRSLASQELRTSYFSSLQDFYELQIDILMDLQSRHPEGGYERLALETSERRRARSLLETLAEADADIRQGVGADLLERERNLQQLIDAKSQAGLKKDVDTLLDQYRDVEAQIRASSPRYAALTQPRPLSWKEIQQLLDPDTLLLEYSLGDDRSYLWAVTPDSLTTYSLPPRQEIESQARELGALLTRPTARSIDQIYDVMAKLSQVVLAPAASQLAGKRLVIVPDGALSYIPFGVLPAPAVGKTASHPEPPLTAEHEIVYLPSASTLAVLRREIQGRTPPPKLLAILADPVFESEDERVRTLTVTSNIAATNQQAQDTTVELARIQLTRSVKESGVTREGGISRLLFTRQEADAIASLVPSGMRLENLDFAASKEAATSPALSQYRMLHFATHGLLNSEHPELSGVVLSLVDEKGSPVDGFLRLHDIYNLKLPADLVVLSACETGLGKEIQGEGLIGLTRGFMYAGTPRVVVSLWNVNDQATAELMKRFYRAMLVDGLRPAAALRSAQMELRNDSRWSAPFYWAGFVLQGEWK
jgi:CHAT domain-containing protein/Flp pilus assembly protein TadD